MKIALTSFLLAFTLSTSAALAEPRPVDLSSLQALQLSESQVQSIFSLFLSRVPMLLGESAQPEQIIEDIAPQALQLLNSEQRRMLSQLLPQEGLESFGSMSREERSRFIFGQARSLVHPSKAEWLDRVEEMTK